jgi:hypothetical protein
MEELKGEDQNMLTRRQGGFSNDEEVPDVHDEDLVFYLGGDFVNTESERQQNLQYLQSPDGDKQIFQTTRHVSAGNELTAGYASDFHVETLLKHWGVYLEERSSTSTISARDCHEAVDHGLRKVLDRDLLLDASLKELRCPNGGDRGYSKDDTLPVWAPRCRAETLQEKQGLMRCNLARLAWEQCSTALGWLPSQQKSSKDEL